MIPGGLFGVRATVIGAGRRPLAGARWQAPAGRQRWQAALAGSAGRQRWQAALAGGRWQRMVPETTWWITLLRWP